MSERQLRSLIGGLLLASPGKAFTAAGICYLLRDRISPAPAMEEVVRILDYYARGNWVEYVGEGQFGPEFRLRGGRG